MRTRKTYLQTVPALVAVLAPAIAFGQVVPPTQLPQDSQELAIDNRNSPIEGWAIVRYSVLADGSTADVRVIDRMPAALPERAVLRNVESWIFQPATDGGSAIDWHNQESTIVVDAETIPLAPTQDFVNGYQEVESLLTEGSYEDALQGSRRLLDTQTARLAEFGVALVQHARVNMALGNDHEAYAAIRRATDPRLLLLEPSEMSVALQYRNTLEMRLGDFVAALETLERRESMGPIPETDVMARNAAAIQSAIASELALAIKGKILVDEWSHSVVRRTFAVGDLDGSLSDVEIDCDRNRAEFEYSETSEWTLPESWGSCTVTVVGRPETEFVFYEFQ